MSEQTPTNPTAAERRKGAKGARLLLSVRDSRGFERLSYSGVAGETMLRFQMELAAEVIEEDRQERELESEMVKP